MDVAVFAFNAADFSTAAGDRLGSRCTVTSYARPVRFFYGTLHLFSYLWLDQFYDWGEIWKDILKRPFITVGMLAFLLMAPLALTSFKKAMRKLGRNWQRLHTLIYPLTMLGVLHFWWLAESKSRLAMPLLYSVLLAILLGERVFRWLQKKGAWRLELPGMLRRS